jgi:hypothetical protein
VSDSSSHAPVKSGQDYVAACSVTGATGSSCSGPVVSPITINAGESSATVTVFVIGNTVQQDTTRHFALKLVSAVNASVRWGLGAGIIIDDDAANPPTATTGDATGIGTDHATVAGTMNPRGEATTAYIEYGTSAPAYGSKTATQTFNDSGDHALSFDLAGLSPGTTYHYRAVATHVNNATGYGDDRTFTTNSPPPPPPPPPPIRIGPPPPPPPPPPPLTPPGLKLLLITKKVTATSKGVVLLTFSCTAPKNRLCRGRVDLDLVGTPAGSTTFKLRPNKRSLVAVKLPRKIWKLLQTKKTLRFNVTIAFKKGAVGDPKLTFQTKVLPVSAPKAKAPAQGK